VVESLQVYDTRNPRSGLVRLLVDTAANLRTYGVGVAANNSYSSKIKLSGNGDKRGRGLAAKPSRDTVP
jgi:hypothetical protein